MRRIIIRCPLGLISYSFQVVNAVLKFEKWCTLKQEGFLPLAGLLQFGALRGDHTNQAILRADKRFGSLTLQFDAERTYINSGSGELGQMFLPVPAVRQHRRPDRPRSAKAFNVLSGMVFTVSGAARDSM